MAQDDFDQEEVREKCKLLYWQGWRVGQLSKKFGINANTIHAWKQRDNWAGTPEIQRVEASITARLMQLAAKEEKTDLDLREIDALSRAMMRTARIRKFSTDGNEVDLNPKLENRRKGQREKAARRNEFTEEEVEQLRESFFSSIFAYKGIGLA